MLTMNEAKKLAKANLAEAAGQEFQPEKSAYLAGGQEGVPTGALGVILPTLSSRGKPQAELTCVVDGCTERHIREISDWHQCTKCETHSKSKSKGSGKSNTPGLGGGRSVKVEGEVFREMKILDTDTDDIRELKIQNNEIFEQLYAQEQARREAEKVAAAEERKAKQEADRIAREAKQAEEKKAAIMAAKERAMKYAAEKGLKVSPRLMAQGE
jgi:hypothetical protein